jgi:hypothetical protein
MATTIMDDEQQAFYVILDTLCNGFLRVRSSQSTFWLFSPGLRVYKFKGNQGIATGRKGVVVVLKMKKVSCISGTYYAVLLTTRTEHRPA